MTDPIIDIDLQGDIIYGYRGFLFIGDPHVSSRKPGRRKDDNFAATVIGKLGQAMDIARKHDLVPIVTGDLTDKTKDESVIVDLIKTLIDRGVYVLVANHDKSEKRLTSNTALAVLREARVIRAIEDCGLVSRFEFGTSYGSEIVSLFAAPYGYQIPVSLSDIDGYVEKDRCILLTHADIEFDDNAYPGAIIPHEIQACELLINGHMHLTKPIKVRGQTTWFNPGNITRMSVDAMHHAPSVWGWTPERGIEQFVLSYSKDVFDLTGYHVDAGAPIESAQSSIFVEMLKAQDSLEIGRTDDGGVLLEEMEKVFKALSVSEEVEIMVRNLHGRVVEAN